MIQQTEYLEILKVLKDKNAYKCKALRKINCDVIVGDCLKTQGV